MLVLSAAACAQQVVSLNVVGVHGRQVTLLVRLNAPAPALDLAGVTEASFNIQDGDPETDTPAEVRVRTETSEAFRKVIVLKR